MDADPNSEIAVSLDAGTGNEIWRTALGPRFVEEFGDGPRATPAVDGDFAYSLTSYGKLFALKTADAQDRGAGRQRPGLPRRPLGFEADHLNDREGAAGRPAGGAVHLRG